MVEEETYRVDGMAKETWFKRKELKQDSSCTRGACQYHAKTFTSVMDSCPCPVTTIYYHENIMDVKLFL